MTRNAQRHGDIHELMGQGLTVSPIARRVKLDRKTVRRFAGAEVAADLLGPGGRRATALDSYLPYLTGRWREGQHVAAFLFDEVWQQAIVAASAPSTSAGRLARCRAATSGPCDAPGSTNSRLAVAPTTLRSG
jgi:hypothetical protein